MQSTLYSIKILSKIRFDIFNKICILLIPLILSSCFDSETEEPKTLDNPVINSEYLSSIDTVIFGQITDAKTGKLIAQPVEVKIKTDSLDNFVDKKGNTLTSDTVIVEDGILDLSIAENSELSESNPINISFIVNASGYISTSEVLNINQQGIKTFVVSMVNTAEGASPKGTSSLTLANITSADNGKISTPIKMLTPLESTTDITTEVFVPENTVITNQEGVPLNGQLSASIVFHNNQDIESLSSLPGGLTNVTVNQNDTEQVGTFISGGFVSLEITDSQGVKAANFSQPIQMATELVPTTINPETQELIKEGDMIPIWSYEPSTAAWTFEGNAYVLPLNDKGNFPIVFSASHLSYWNMDWIKYGDRVCSRSSTIDIIGNNDMKPIRYQLSRLSGGWTGRSLVDRSNQLGFYNIMDDEPLVLTAQLAEKKIQKTFDDLCSDLPLTFDVTELTQQAFKSIAVTVDKVVCETFDIEVPDSTFIQYKSPFSKGYTTSYITKDDEGNGKILLNDLSVNLNYDVKLVTKGRAFGKDYNKTFDRTLFIAEDTSDEVIDLSSYCKDVDDKLVIPEVTFSRSSTTTYELEGTQYYSISVKLDDAENMNEPLLVKYSVNNNSSVNINDFEAPNVKEIVFQPGETQQFIDLLIKDDDLPEATEESFVLRLMPEGNIASGRFLTHKVIIVDNDKPIVSIDNNNSSFYFNEDEGQVDLALSLDKTYSYPITVDLVSYDRYKNDIAIPNSVTFNIGETRKNISVNIIEDDVPEKTEKFYVKIKASNNDRYLIGNRYSSFNIIDNDIRYEKLNALGEPISDNSIQAYCVRDKLNNRIWEVKNQNNKDTLFQSVDEVNDYIDNLNTEKLCGFGSWTAPDFIDMYSLKDDSGYRFNDVPVFINTDFFPNAKLDSSDLYFAKPPLSWSIGIDQIKGYLFNHQRSYGFYYFYIENASPSPFYLRAVISSQ